LFGADNILWVEGSTEEECFPKIIQAMSVETPVGLAIIAVRATGDFEGRRAPAVAIWEIYDRLSKAGTLMPVTLAIILDMEGRTEADIENRKTHHDNELDHDHDDFESFVVPLPESSDPQALSDLVSATAEAAGVLRIKGFAAVSNKPMRLLVQAVGPRVTTQYDRAWMPSEKRQTQLVVIGLKGLDRDKIVRMLNG